MSADITLSARIGYRWRVTFQADPAQVTTGRVLDLAVSWEPRLPRQLSAKERADYRAARAAFMAELAQVIGGRVAVADIDIGTVAVFDRASGSDTARGRC